VDTTGNESSRSLVTDSSINENVMVFSEDRRAVLTIPKQVRGVLLNSDNEYNDDIRLSIQKIDNVSNDKVVCAYIIRAYKAKTGEEVKNLSFLKSKTEFTLSYEGASGYSAGKTVSTMTGSELGVFWYDGANYVNLGGDIDETNQSMSLNTEHIGIYRIQRVLRAAELRITAIWPRKTFTPNGDEINDTFNIQFENPWESNIHGYVYDLNGALVTEFIRDGDKLYWDGRDNNSSTVKSGLYIYQLRGENKTINGTVVVAR
jgi:gliding motility-associated-like protein